MRILKMILPALIILVALCSGPYAGTSHADELVVSAAASLTGVFVDIGKGFEKENSGTKVLFNFAASGALLQQIVRGAPVDVFASADMETMDKARTKGIVDTTSVVKFAGNRLVLIAPRGSALGGLSGLGNGSVRRIAVGNPDTVPVGRYAKQTLEINGMWAALEPKFIYAESVRQALDYVSRGEVDAGFVYATDAAVAADKINVVTEIGGHKPVVYPAAVVAAGKNKTAARKFIEYVLSGKGQAILARYGFTKP